MLAIKFTKKDKIMNTQDYLVLVNKTHTLPEKSAAEMALGSNLVKVTSARGDFLLEEKTADAFAALVKAVSEQTDFEIGVSDGFRTFEEQRATYNEIKKQQGKREANTSVAPAGASEHHTGLGVDYYVATPKNLTSFWTKVKGKLSGKSAAGEYINKGRRAVLALANDYGFIERYPSGAEDTTGYPAEPWHLRFVGSPEKAHQIANWCKAKQAKDPSGKIYCFEDFIAENSSARTSSEEEMA